MLVIHFRFAVFMTIDAGKFIIIGRGVAVGTGQVGVLTRKDRELMVETGLVPGGGSPEMANFAVGGKTRFPMIGIFCVVIIIQMAAHTFA